MEASSGKKAEEDYTKRTGDPLGLTPSDTTFVFVTPRVWPGRVKWQSGKRAAGTWKDVRVIAADGLEQWLDLAPAVALWLARQLKGLSDSIRDIGAFWEEWSAATDPKFTTDIVIGGRVKDMMDVQEWLNRKASILEVRGDSPNEPVAFLYGAITNLPELERLKALSRCVLVETIQQMRECATTFQNPLVIVAPADCRDAAGFCVDKGHHVFLSADSRSIDLRRNLMELSRPRRETIEQQLRECGLSGGEAGRIAQDFGRSIPVLRRHRFRSSARTPAWADEKSVPLLLPLLFAGAWDAHKEGDRGVIESLSGMTHEAYVKTLTPLLTIEDSPIRNIGSVWMLKSPLDAWFLLAPHITEEHLTSFQRALASVLTKTDPKYDLEAEKRWAAALYGKANPCSEWLRIGLVESLVLLAVYGDRSSYIASTQTFVDRVVREVFTFADRWEAWASIKDVTPLLAEAAPDAFLDVTSHILANKPEIFTELMSDDGTVFGECRHTGLLWALEGIAWHPDYFARAAAVLLDLARVDKGGRWGNRPDNSLRDIFVAGRPQTNATVEQRLTVWDVLVDKDAARVWKFAKTYFNGGSMSASHQFRWRDTGGDRKGLEAENEDNQRGLLAGILPRLNDLACRRENLTSAVDEFTRLPEEARKKLLAKLEQEKVKSFSKNDQAMLRQHIREALNWINSYGDDERRKQVAALWRVYDKFTPSDMLERHGWLLGDPWPRLPEGEPQELDSKETKVKLAQQRAAREILDHVPLERVIDFATTIQYIGTLGHAIASVVRDREEDGKVLDAMIESIEKCPFIIRGYSFGRVETVGLPWVDEQISRLRAKGTYTPQVCALLYLGREEGMPAWSDVASHGGEVEEAYWKEATGYSRTDKDRDTPFAVEKLLDAKRPRVALRLAGDPKASIPSHLLQRLLQDLLIDNAGRADPVMDEFHLGHVFRQLHQRDDLSIEEMARLEWPYAALFKDFRQYANSPMAIHRALQTDPTFFAQLVSFIYKRDDQKPNLVQESLDPAIVERRAHTARDVLDSWHLLPGVKDDGNVDEGELIAWITTARGKCAETGHVIGGDIEIGFILAYAPSDPDGTWPLQAARNVIERLNNDTIDDHIRNKTYNRRGVVTRSVDDGGDQERDLAERYKRMADAVKARWPRTSKLLRILSDTYSHQAKSEDIDSDLQDWRWS